MSTTPSSSSSSRCRTSPRTARSSGSSSRCPGSECRSRCTSSGGRQQRLRPSAPGTRPLPEPRAVVGHPRTIRCSQWVAQKDPRPAELQEITLTMTDAKSGASTDLRTFTFTDAFPCGGRTELASEQSPDIWGETLEIAHAGLKLARRGSHKCRSPGISERAAATSRVANDRVRVQPQNYTISKTNIWTYKPTRARTADPEFGGGCR